MDRQNSAATTPDSPAKPPQPISETSCAGFSTGDVHHACAMAQAVVAIAMGQMPFGQPDTGPHTAPVPARAAAFARQIAMYLAHVGFGLSMAAIGRAFGRDRTTVLHACHSIEDRRDELQFDKLLDLLEQAAVTLHAAGAIHWQGLRRTR